MNRSITALVAGVSAMLLAAGCASDKPATSSAAPETSAAASSAATAAASSNTGEQSKFFVQADYDAQLAMRTQSAEGPADKPWEQAIAP
ncbi:hypothetical protein ACSDR0_43520, partial [Streptosporangium sp. G11]